MENLKKYYHLNHQSRYQMPENIVVRPFTLVATDAKTPLFIHITISLKFWTPPIHTVTYINETNQVSNVTPTL